ncbi:MAG: hypothetical protein JXR18_15515 [Neptuniibacter sp.]
MNIENVRYAQDKIASVRSLHRTSLPIPHAVGTYQPKGLIPIIGGILTLDSDWNPPLGTPFITQLKSSLGDGRLDINCVVSQGYCYYDSENSDFNVHAKSRSSTAFLFKLISMLQFSGTVPMIDIEKYSEWIQS